jgi:hypothetical protein
MIKNIKSNFEETHNIKSILRMNSYLKRVFNSYRSLYTTFVTVRDEIYTLQNELNLRSVDAQLLESYNKMITFMENEVNGVLDQTILGPQCSETTVIQPVNTELHQYSHKLEITYFLPNMISTTKPLGSISNMSLIKINEHVKILRSDLLYDFVYIDSAVQISVNDFRDHLNSCLNDVKQLLAWFYNDIDFTKIAFKGLLDVMASAIKMSNCKGDQKKWLHLLKKIKVTVDTVYETITNLDKCSV